MTVENDKKFVTQENAGNNFERRPPIVKKISNYLSNNGYSLQNFSGIEDSQIISTNYNLQLDILIDILKLIENVFNNVLHY